VEHLREYECLTPIGADLSQQRFGVVSFRRAIRRHVGTDTVDEAAFTLAFANVVGACPPSDRQQPQAYGCFASKRIERLERSKIGLLDEILDVTMRTERPTQPPDIALRAAHQLGHCDVVALPSSVDQCSKWVSRLHSATLRHIMGLATTGDHGNLEPMASDFNTMSCADVQEAISAIIDDEHAEMDPTAIDAHVSACAHCAAFRQSSIDARRRLGLRVVDEPDDLHHRIAPLAAVADRAGSWRVPRVLLFVVAVEVLVLSTVDMVSADGSASQVHDSRHLSAFTLAYAVLLLVVVARPARARTALPVAGVLAAALAITAIADLVVGRIPLVGEALHLPELLSVLLIFLLAVPGPRRRARQESKARTGDELTIRRG
jgi:predicted anti-sigma-YlaC factor YlaD